MKDMVMHQKELLRKSLENYKILIKGIELRSKNEFQKEDKANDSK